jgi:hypothetical protein
VDRVATLSENIDRQHCNARRLFLSGCDVPQPVVDADILGKLTLHYDLFAGNRS